MHTRQGAAEPARIKNNAAHAEEMATLRDPIAAEYLFAHLLREGPNCSRITVGPRWLEGLIRLFVSLTCKRRLEKLDAIWMGLVAAAALGSVVAIAVLLVGER